MPRGHFAVDGRTRTVTIQSRDVRFGSVRTGVLDNETVREVGAAVLGLVGLLGGLAMMDTPYESVGWMLLAVGVLLLGGLLLLHLLGWVLAAWVLLRGAFRLVTGRHGRPPATGERQRAHRARRSRSATQPYSVPLAQVGEVSALRGGLRRSFTIRTDGSDVTVSSGFFRGRDEVLRLREDLLAALGRPMR